MKLDIITYQHIIYLILVCVVICHDMHLIMIYMSLWNAIYIYTLMTFLCTFCKLFYPTEYIYLMTMTETQNHWIMQL